jgi:diguanylate cyclase (GGDEF)-like protein
LTEYGRAGAQTETLSLAVLMGFQTLPREREALLRGNQFRAVDRMVALRLTLAIVSIGFVDLLCLVSVPSFLLATWTIFALIVHLPLAQLKHRHERAGYEAATRKTVFHHAFVCFLQGAVWSLPLMIFSRSVDPVDMVALWTLTSCLMTAVAIAYHPTPLSSAVFLAPVGCSSVLMMTQQSDPLLTAVVVTYTLLLLVTSLRQAHQFGEQLSTSRQLAEKQEVVSLLLREHHDEGADWLWQTDEHGWLADVSPIFAGLLGTTPDRLEGRPLLGAILGEGWEKEALGPALQLFVDKVTMGNGFADLVLPVLIAGKQRWWEMSASPRMDDKGVFLGFRGVGSDITVQRESADQIAQLARHDMLTHLPNRLYLNEQLTAAIDDMERWDRPCAVLLIDLDRFKAVNDKLGHMVGDELLVQVAARLRDACSSSDIPGRLGGDEFAVVLREAPDSAAIERLAGRVIGALTKPYQVEGRTLSIGASVGSATAPRDGRTARTLMHCADLAMYRAKEAGGARHFAYVPAMQADIEERRTLELALRDAMSKDQLHLVYQPVLNAQAGTITTFEALVRWTHPDYGAVAPERFIPVAEEARLIGPIGDWVLRNACQEATSWPEAIRLSVNISPEQLRDPAFLETIVSALAHSGLAPGRLELEVTENVFLRETNGVMKLLDKLNKIGVGLLLDDFGTGQSSIGYLARHRFREIKIDRAIVNGAARNQRESLAIVRAIVAMATSLGIPVTAEGIESEMEYQRLRDLGCERVQGYYFGRPMSAEKARALFGQRGSQVA